MTGYCELTKTNGTKECHIMENEQACYDFGNEQGWSAVWYGNTPCPTNFGFPGVSKQQYPMYQYPMYQRPMYQHPMYQHPMYQSPNNRRPGIRIPLETFGPALSDCDTVCCEMVCDSSGCYYVCYCC